MRIRIAPTLATIVASLVLAGCGGGSDDDGAGSDTTPQERTDACLTQQPDATRAECEEWEEAGELDDDGVHQGHESMDG